MAKAREPRGLISLRLPPEDEAFIEDVLAFLESQPPQIPVNRSDLLRRALRLGLEAIKRERMAPPTKPRKGRKS